MSTSFPVHPAITVIDDKPSYRAVFELTTRPRGLSKQFAGAGQTQYATLFHPATALKTVRLHHVWVTVVSLTTASWTELQLIPLTATTVSASGNPAITAAPVNAGYAAAEVTCLALPTTAGSQSANAYSTVAYNAGITAAASTTNPPPPSQWVDLVACPNGADTEAGQFPVIRAGKAEGWAVVADIAAATTLVGLVMVDFTEE